MLQLTRAQCLRTYVCLTKGGSHTCRTPVICHPVFKPANFSGFFTAVRTAYMPRDLLQTLTPKQLLQLTGEVIDELFSRGIARTGNNPLADYTEWLIARRLGWTLADPSVQGYDAIDPATNERYEIKSRRITPRTTSRQLSAIRAVEDEHFDFLVAVVYDQSFDIVRAFKIPRDVVQRVGRRSAHTNSLILYARDSLLTEAGVEDITDLLHNGE